MDPKGMREYTPNIWPMGEDGLVITLQCCAYRWKYSDLILKQFQPKSIDFGQKMSDFQF